MWQKILNLFKREDRLFGATRSPEWPKLRKEYIKNNPNCAVCGTDRGIEAHHIKVFHLFPQEELNLNNLISLCDEHHFWFGHFGSWRSWNENVRIDSEVWSKKIKNRPKS